MTWIIAAFLPIAVLGDVHGGMECCQSKELNNQKWIYEGMQEESAAQSYGCKDGCVYVLQGTEDRYCFAYGDEDVHCMNDNGTGNQETTTPPPLVNIVTDENGNPVTLPSGNIANETTMGSSMGSSMPPSMAPSMNSSTTAQQGCMCGKKKPGTENKDSRIVGGSEAQVNEWPWMAAISFYSSTGAGSNYGCGASLISAEWLVTASHCFYGDNGAQEVFAADFTIVLGDHDKSVLDDTTIRIVKNAEKVIIHPNYNPNTLENDIALIKMTSEVDLDIYTPVCMPSLNQQFSGFSWIYGWGTLSSGGSQPNILQEISLPIIGVSNCQAAMSQEGVDIVSGMLCAGGEEGRDSCQGDSGGPMTVDVNGKHYLAGAVSFGIGCAQGGLYGVYAEVAYYKTWIDTSINANGGAEYCPM